MSNIVKSVIVLGGGTAGFIAAMGLRTRHPNMEIKLIRSRDIPIIGVGEGTTGAIGPFLHGYLNIDLPEFYREVQPIWKLGIHYLWGPRPSFNYTFNLHLTAGTPLPRALGYYFDECIESGSVESSLIDNNRAFIRDSKTNLPHISCQHAYHLENKIFVAYLEKVAMKVGIKIIDDTVTNVQVGECGVEKLHLASGRAEVADLYVDCSGFASELMGKALQEPFISYQSSLFCDRAVVGGWQRASDEPIQPYTVAETMDAGWCWRIDHETLINRGYVYSSSFISDEQADQEFRRKNPKVKNTRVVKFTTGRHQRAWVKNVVAIGNAGGFVEPLEATAIAVICEQARGLGFALKTCGGDISSKVVEVYNNRDARYWDAIRRFLAVHYKFNTRLDTPFWRAARETTDLAGAEPIVEFYQQNGPDWAWATTMIDNHDQFGMEGYLTMFVGQKVPHFRKHMPSPNELTFLRQMRDNYRLQATSGFTVEQALATIRLPDWKWNPSFFKN